MKSGTNLLIVIKWGRTGAPVAFDGGLVVIFLLFLLVVGVNLTGFQRLTFGQKFRCSPERGDISFRACSPSKMGGKTHRPVLFFFFSRSAFSSSMAWDFLSSFSSRLDRRSLLCDMTWQQKDRMCNEMLKAATSLFVPLCLKYPHTHHLRVLNLREFPFLLFFLLLPFLLLFFLLLCRLQLLLDLESAETNNLLFKQQWMFYDSIHTEKVG